MSIIGCFENFFSGYPFFCDKAAVLKRLLLPSFSSFESDLQSIFSQKDAGVEHQSNIRLQIKEKIQHSLPMKQNGISSRGIAIIYIKFHFFSGIV